MGKNDRKQRDQSDVNRGDWQLQAERQAAERAILVGVHLPENWKVDLGGDADTEELGQLVETAGGQVVGVVEQRRHRPDRKTFIGAGKLEDVKQLIEEQDAGLVVFDNELTPAQGRNLEKVLDVTILDRTEVILDIFASHARSRQARLQVELAQHQYMLPRLRSLWSHLDRQAGGIGTRGPGETELETDRRIVMNRIAKLKRQLREIATSGEVRRGGRDEFFRAVFVGYTNAGKSTLMNRVTGAEVYVRNQLFATLDATTRRVEVDERHSFLLTDTVGFIRRLPHHLVESFKATLDEVASADLLVHVVDASSEDPQMQIDSVNRVLKDIVPDERPCLLVFNKMDQVDRELFTNRFARHHTGALFVSALDEEGPEVLREAIISAVKARENVYCLRLPVERLDCLAVFHRTGSILKQEFDAETCSATVRMREEEWRRLTSREPDITTAD